MKNVDKKYLIVFAALVVVIALIFHFRPQKKNYEKLSIVKDNSKFFTVSSCVSKYLNYVKAKDTASLIVLLDNKYVKDNDIYEDNVLNYVELVDDNQSFTARKMYSEQVGKSTYKYYVYGDISETFIDEEPKYIKDLYLIVYLNENGMTYSVEPYDGEMFNK